MDTLMKVAMWLLVIGGLAWGLEGLTEINIFDMVFLGFGHVVETLVDVALGLSALYVAFGLATGILN
ncbi:MAG: DUF378 domain-containing protein [Candidatus Bilamarchaeaceae archaeon]